MFRLKRWMNTWSNRDFRNDTNENWSIVEYALNSIKSLIGDVETKINKRIDNLIVNSIGNNIAELVDSHLDTKGFLHSTLKGRLDAIEYDLLDMSFNVKWLGAKGNGTDATEAIQKALDRRGVIYIPAGEFIINKMLVISADTILIMHPNAVLKRGSGIYALFINGKTDDKFLEYEGNGNIKIISGILDVDGFNIKENGGGIFFGHAKNIEVRNTLIKNVYNTHHIEINSTKNALISNCRFEGFNHDGNRSFSEAIQIDLALGYPNFPVFGEWDGTTCKNITIENCHFENVGRGIGTHVIAPEKFHDTITIVNNTFEKLLDVAVYALGFKKLTVSSNKIEYANKGIYLENVYESSITSNNVKYCEKHGFEIKNSNTVDITGNKSTRNGADGFAIHTNSFAIICAHNFSQFNVGVGMSIAANTVSITDCVVKENQNNGVAIYNKSINVKMNGCTVNDNGRNGIVITDGSVLCSVENCFVLANNTAGYVASNIIIYDKSYNNRIVNNMVRVGENPFKPGAGVHVDIGCESNTVALNDLRNSGSMTGLYDLGTQTNKKDNQGVA